MTLIEELTCLVGQKLGAITFIHDYWQLHFDDSILTVESRLTVAAETLRYRDGDAGFRDVLCKQVGATVHSAALTPTHLLITFENDGRIEASIRDEDYRGPEALKFSREGRTYII